VTLPRDWVLATGNPGKVAELAALFAEAELAIEITPQSRLGVVAPAETGLTFVENALLKARHAARVTGLPAIADDSGLAVAALGGAPGIYSARFAGAVADDDANIDKLLASLGEHALDRSARFHCVLVALERADDPAPIIASGSWSGEIALARRGTAGFGYDPVFFDRVLGVTAAELDPATKNRVSHRGAALRQLVELLRNR
jgi:XTP/dITP diphosphohydrolase